ncbi:cytochrome P450 [Leucogyrophana mollusca]|uniref:Cytochrome P450 n=1 Tax=Leucogyrophana mollusca TaxID=85980 RepID=A0ACB8B3W9_9AGAM|nr:cytochrome P450 [Leucogyrophana mollusca]
MSPWATLAIVVLAASVIWRRAKRRSLYDIRGPAVPSRLLGHEKMIQTMKQVGDLEFRWAREFGPTWLTQGCYGEEKLWTADPKALQYVFHTSGYRFPKSTVADEIMKLFAGQGILSASGDNHQRHRKIMNPAFSAAQIRGFLPIVQRSAAQLSQKWKDQLQSSLTPGGEIINVRRMLARMTLDVIGEVAFDDQLGALDDKEHELAKAFERLFIDTLLYPPTWDLLFKASWRYFPASIRSLIKYLPTKEYRRFRTFLRLAFRTGKRLIEEKATDTEKGSRDIMSILVQSNLSEDPRFRLSETEMLSQIATLLNAGHDTTAYSLTWLLYELAKHPEDQQKIREEIATARARFEARHGDDFTSADLEAMIFMNAVIKESLRLHPIIPTLARDADYDDVLPLAVPIETKSGNIITEIPIPKGTQILISISTYNRLESVWGEDAAEWNPTRFLHDEERTSVGVFANLMTFGGVRGCIGWRFALLEMQAVLVELIERFDFQFPEGVEIIRLNAGIMIPMVKGKMQEGAQVPLRVSLLR